MGIRTVGELRQTLDKFVAEDEFRSDMRLVDGELKPFLSLDVQRDKHNLVVLVLDSAGVRVTPKPAESVYVMTQTQLNTIHAACQAGTQAHGDEFYGPIMDVIDSLTRRDA